MSILSRPEFHDEQAAYDYVEARIWPHGATCPKCGERERVSKMGGKSTRIGAYKCYKCRKPFTVKVGTIFESSHVPMNIWLQAIYLMCASKKGISSQQLHRTLGVTLKTAWFMSHRIREAMRTDHTGLMGGDGGVVEADETFIGKDPKMMRYHPKDKPIGIRQKMKVLALVDRNTGKVRSQVIDHLSKRDIAPILSANIAKEARLSTDEASYYRTLGKDFADHLSVNHSAGEYVAGDAHTNTLEGYFSIFKRGMRGVYQHCAKPHLHRYAAEFEFRYNHRIANGADDKVRSDIALIGVVGKRLTYQTIGV